MLIVAWCSPAESRRTSDQAYGIVLRGEWAGLEVWCLLAPPAYAVLYPERGWIVMRTP